MATKAVSTKKSVPTVTVETKKISSEKDVCCSKDACAPVACKKFGKIALIALTLLNTILLVVLLSNQSGFEAARVGGNENYKLLKQVFATEGYKTQQKQQIEQALQMFNQPTQAATAQQAGTPIQQEAQQAPTQAQQRVQQQAPAAK